MGQETSGDVPTQPLQRKGLNRTAAGAPAPPSEQETRLPAGSRSSRGPGGTPAPLGAPDKGRHAGARALLLSAQDTPKRLLLQTEPLRRACCPSVPGVARCTVPDLRFAPSLRDPNPLYTLSRAEKGAAGRWDRPGENNQE